MKERYKAMRELKEIIAEIMKKENIIKMIAIGCVIIVTIIGIIMYSMPKTYKCKNCHSTNIELKTTYNGVSHFQCNECNAISTYY